MRYRKLNNNILIRNSMKEHQVFQYEVAEILGISEPTLIRWLRKELPEDEQKRIVSLIEEHAGQIANA